MFKKQLFNTLSLKKYYIQSNSYYYKIKMKMKNIKTRNDFAKFIGVKLQTLTHLL